MINEVTSSAWFPRRSYLKYGFAIPQREKEECHHFPCLKDRLLVVLARFTLKIIFRAVWKCLDLLFNSCWLGDFESTFRDWLINTGCTCRYTQSHVSYMLPLVPLPLKMLHICTFLHIQAHDSSVRAMVWSHDNNWMITGDHNGYVKYWQSNMNNVKAFQVSLCVLCVWSVMNG